MKLILHEIVDSRNLGLNSDQGLTQCFVRQLTMEEKNSLTDIVSFTSSFCQSDLALGSNDSPWISVTPTQAHKICLLALIDNYGAFKFRIPHARAVELVDLFLSFFSVNAKYFTKSEYEFEDEKNLIPWKSKGAILVGGIEHGVICIDVNNIGILWVKDDD